MYVIDYGSLFAQLKTNKSYKNVNGQIKINYTFQIFLKFFLL